MPTKDIRLVRGGEVFIREDWVKKAVHELKDWYNNMEGISFEVALREIFGDLAKDDSPQEKKSNGNPVFFGKPADTQLKTLKDLR